MLNRHAAMIAIEAQCLLLLTALLPASSFLAPTKRRHPTSTHHQPIPAIRHPKAERAASSDVSDLLYQEQEKAIVRRGEKEETFFSDARPLEVTTIDARGSGKAGGFGKATARGGGSKARAAMGKGHAKVLKREGVLRVDGALRPDTADAVRDHLYELRRRSEREVREGRRQPIERFANVLLKHNRCDLTVPLGERIITEALRELLLISQVGATISSVFGDGAVLHELSCLMSDPGSQRQVIHPDTPHIDGKGPVLLTCFVALQDVTPDMGPTVWLPRTHTRAVHAAFSDPGGKDALLRTTPARLGLLPKGGCAMFDSRLLHCGSANLSADSRALFYCSFRDPGVSYTGNPASIRQGLGSANVSLGELMADLESAGKGKGSPLIDRLGSQMA